MQGFITGKDVIIHTKLIIKEYGFGKYLNCVKALLSRKQTTFLSVITQE